MSARKTEHPTRNATDQTVRMRPDPARYQTWAGVKRDRRIGLLGWLAVDMRIVKFREATQSASFYSCYPRTHFGDVSGVL